MADCKVVGKTTNVYITAEYTATTGACCTGVCTCNVTTEANCSGTWYTGQSCPGSCPSCPPKRACCTGGGSCSLEYEVNCTGTWKSSETSCSPNPCQGACCDGESCTSTTEGGCAHTYKGDGTECSTPDICALSGACCLPNFGGCSLLTSAACSTASGVYEGDDTTCTPSPCPVGHGGPIVIS